jgi:hypothetical protein
MRTGARFLLIIALALAPRLAHAQAESAQDYPAGSGRDLTFAVCTACHGFKVVAQQGQSRRQWDDTLDWMTQRHSMPKLEGEARTIVLDYLEASFPPRTSPRGFQNPFQNR